MQEYERKRQEEEQKKAAEAAAQRKREDDARAAEEARVESERKASIAKKANATCTQNGQVSQVCVEFFTSVDQDRASPVENKGYLRDCFTNATTASGNVSSAEQILRAQDSSKYAGECLRMTDAARGAAWRKPQDDILKRAAFDSSLEDEVNRGFKAKCGMGGAYGGRGFLVVEKKSTSTAVFLSKKNPDGNQVTVLCSGNIVTRFSNGGSSTAFPKTEAQVAAERDLRKCAEERSKILPDSCPQGRISYERGVSACIKAAEAMCKK
jgi:hypothetical protein